MNGSQKSNGSVLKMVLGEEYHTFEKDFLVKSLEDLAEKGRLSRKTLELIKLGLSKGEGLHLREERLEYQSRNARDGGDFLRVSLDLPDGVSLSSFVKIQSSKERLKNESQLNRSLSKDAESKHVLPILYLNEDKQLMATPFVEGERATEKYIRAGTQQHGLMMTLLDSLLDTYKRAKEKGIKPARNDRSKNGSARVNDIVIPWLTGKKTFNPGLEDLVGEVRRCVDERNEPELNVLLHGDAQLNNFIVDGDKTYIIDWEMSRKGSIHYDIYRLLLRSKEKGKSKDELLERAWGFSRENLGYGHGLSEFIASYMRIECIEDLFVAGVFKDLSRSCEPSMKNTLEAAGDLYYTKSLHTARTLGLETLAKQLEKNAAALNCKELDGQEYDLAEETLTVSDSGFSRYFQMSQPASKEEARTVTKLIRQNKRKGFLGTLKRAAVAAIVATGIAIGGIGHYGLPSKNTEQATYVSNPEHLTFINFPFDRFLDRPDIKKVIGGGYQEYRSNHKINYLEYLYPRSDEDVRRSPKISFDQYLRLFWGNPKKSQAIPLKQTKTQLSEEYPPNTDSKVAISIPSIN